MFSTLLWSCILLQLACSQSCKGDQFSITVERQTKRFASMEVAQVLWNRGRVMSYILSQDNTYAVKQFCIAKHERQWYSLLMNSISYPIWDPGSWIALYGEYGNKLIQAFPLKSQRSEYMFYPGYLVRKDSQWQYEDTRQPSDWKLFYFNDFSWKSFIPITSTIITSSPTVYIRHTFVGMVNITAIDLHVSYRCGIIVYLDGTEVFRDHLPQTAVTYTTYAMHCSLHASSVILSGTYTPNSPVTVAVEYHFASEGTNKLSEFYLWIQPLSSYLLYKEDQRLSSCHFVTTAAASSSVNTTAVTDFDYFSAFSHSTESPFSFYFNNLSTHYQVNGVTFLSLETAETRPRVVRLAARKEYLEDWIVLGTFTDVAPSSSFYMTALFPLVTSSYRFFRVDVIASHSAKFTVNEMRLLVCSLPQTREIPFNQHDVRVITHVTPVLLYPLYGGYSGCTVNSTLPAGLSLDVSTCVISGVVMLPGTWTFSIFVQHSTFLHASFVIRSSYCDGIILFAERYYGSNSVSETYAVLDGNTRELFSEQRSTDQALNTVTRKAACVRNGTFVLQMNDDSKKFWDCDSSLLLALLTEDGGITMPLATTRYDSNRGETLDISFRVAIFIPHKSTWDIKSFEPTQGLMPTDLVYHFAFEKTFHIDSLESLHSLRVYVRYRCGIVILINRREVYRQYVNGTAEPSTMGFRRCYHTLRYRIFSIPIITVTDTGQLSYSVYSGDNEITVYTASNYDNASEFDMVLFGNSFPSRSVVYDASISVQPRMPHDDHPFNACPLALFYYSGTPNNSFTVTFYNGRREWISAFVITSSKDSINEPKEITLEAKNLEDANWTELTRVTNMIWWRKGQSKTIYLNLARPYNQYRFRNINHSSLNDTEWSIQSIDIIQSLITSHSLYLEYPMLSTLYNEYPQAVLYPATPLYSHFSPAADLPREIWVDGATGVIGGRLSSPRSIFVYLTAQLLSSITTSVGFTLALESCSYVNNYIFLTIYPPRLHPDLFITLEDEVQYVWELESFPYMEDEVTLFLCLPPDRYRLIISSSGNTGWVFPSSFSVAIASRSNIVVRDYINASPDNVYIFSNINPILDCDLFNRMSDTHERWTSRVPVHNPPSCTPIIFPRENGTIYVRYAIEVPDIVFFHMLTVRIRSSYCFAVSFNGRGVGKFGLESDPPVCMSVNRSAYRTIHIPLIENGGFTGTNDLILLMFPPVTLPDFFVNVSGYFGVDKQLEFDHVVSSAEIQSVGIESSSVLFDGDLETTALINPLKLNMLEFPFINREGQAFTTLSLYVSHDFGPLHISLLGKPADEVLQPHPHFNDDLESIVVSDSPSFKQHRYVISVPQGQWKMQSLRLRIYSFEPPAFLGRIGEIMLGYKADGVTLICPALGNFPAVKEGTDSPGPCPANYSGTALRLCSGGLLGDLDLSGCLMIPPLNLRYPRDAFEFSQHIFNSTGTPSFDFIVQSYEIISGELPQGLELNEETGEIAGVPTGRGRFVLGIRGKNRQGTTDTSISIHISLSMCDASGYDSRNELGTQVWIPCSRSVGGVGFIKRECVFMGRFMWVTNATYCVQGSVVTVTFGVLFCILFIVLVSRYVHHRRVKRVLKLSKLLLKRTAGMVLIC